MTLRDQVWDAALQQIAEDGQFKLSDLPFDESERHTVRRVLKEMEKHDWLSRESQHAAIWRLGDTSKEILNISEDTLEAAVA